MQGRRQILRYFDAGNAAVAINPKAGSSTLAREIIRVHHPDQESLVTTPPGEGKGTAYPPGKSADTTRLHFLVPKVEALEREVTIIPVRDPVERFRSACAESNRDDVDAVIEDLKENRIPRNSHFWNQVRLLQGNKAKLYKFPDHFPQLLEEIGVGPDVVDIHQRDNRIEKPELTEAQVAAVKELYADDVRLFESINEPGQEVQDLPNPVVKEPVPGHVTKAQLRKALRRVQIAFANLPILLESIEDPDEREDALIDLQEAQTIDRTHPLIGFLAEKLNLEQDDVDDIFRQAATL